MSATEARPGGGAANDAWHLAIDFGTTFTCAAMRDADRIEVLEIENSRYLPSLVLLDREGNLSVGRAAVNSAKAWPERAVRLPKRALVQGPRTLLNGSPVETAELVAAVLRRVADEARRRHDGRPPETVVLTHPARWGTEERGRLEQAAARAGLPPPNLLSEPEAAARHYSSRDLPEGAHVAVYDLGGGTFDTAVLVRTSEGYQLAGPTGGDPFLGGEDLDEILHALVEEHARARDGEPWDELCAGDDRRSRNEQWKLREDITEAKVALSEHVTTFVYVPGYDDEFRITRGEFESRIEERLSASAAELVRTIENANLKATQLAAVYLTGGSSRIPRVSELVADALGHLPRIEGDPKAVVVQGALAEEVRPPKGRGPVRTRIRGEVIQTVREANAVAAIAFSPDGRWLATTDWGTARVRDATTGVSRVEVGHKTALAKFWRTINSVAFSPDGLWLATGGRDKTARIWDRASGQQLLSVSHDGIVRAVAFSPDSRWLATGSDDKTARIWDAAGGRELLRVNHDDFVRTVAFSPDGRWLATGGDDKTARIWDAADGEELFKVSHDGWVKGVAFSRDGGRLATASDKTARIWALTEMREVSQR
jgi:actin-like ATPase involved in cell morphogenesis/sugar lactone lactonase YvrE